MGLSLLLLQVPLTVEQIHAEDARVIETALVHYYRLERSNTGTIRVPNVTAGPAVAENGIVDTSWDEKSRRDRSIPVNRTLRSDFRARNAYPVSLSWLHPKNNHLRLFSETSRPLTRDPRVRHAFLYWILMPGYTEDRLHAAVSFGFGWSLSHIGRSTIWLTKTDGTWKVTEVCDAHYL